jgi:hypothetical protein
MFEPGYTEKVVNYCSGVAYTYRDAVNTPENISNLDGPAIGDRAPDIDFEQGGRLFDRLRHKYLTLLAMPAADELGPLVDRVTKRFAPVIEAETLPRSAALSNRYGPSDGRLFLVRPDGYVAFKCGADDVELLETHLATTLSQ